MNKCQHYTRYEAVLVNISLPQTVDENSQHGLCPKGPDSWCKYKKTKVTVEKYSHKNSIPIAVVKIIQPVFRP